MSRMLGIVGGMGPLASTEFIRMIYELSSGKTEQCYPQCMLYSDPTFPDRTEAILNGSTDELVSKLATVLTKMQQIGIEKIVICCITMHYVLPQIPETLRARIISLVDVIIDAILDRRQTGLMLCTLGARKVRVFENSDRWNEVMKYVLFPNEDDQALIQESIYRLKARVVPNDLDASLCASILQLRSKYGADLLIAGCTEFHLLRQMPQWPNLDVIDPLVCVAHRMNSCR